MRSLISLIFSCFLMVEGAAQPVLSYYLPEGVTYNPAIPTPQSVIGHEVGEWHISHDRLVNYMYALDRASDRIALEVTGYTHEGRPLLLLTITSPKNHQNLETIRSQHVQLTDPAKSGNLDTRSMPVVFYMGFSIHGNEASGSNAALLVAYHLAAAQGKEIEEYLNNVVVLFDPSFNPDGLHRFSSWVNSRKSKVVSADPADMEHNEPWPGGRTNHYWFDLNRDWLVAQQPESQARSVIFHKWKPNVLTDHHEMGTNATFFFQPVCLRGCTHSPRQKIRSLPAKSVSSMPKPLTTLAPFIIPRKAMMTSIMAKDQHSPMCREPLEFYLNRPAHADTPRKA